MQEYVGTAVLTTYADRTNENEIGVDKLDKLRMPDSWIWGGDAPLRYM